MGFVRRMDHFTIVTDQPEKTREFYAALGLNPGARPNFQVHGFWLYATDTPILHVIQVKDMPKPVRGGLDNMAFRAEGLMKVLEHLKAKEVKYRLTRAPEPFRTWQLFFPDPNGIEVEMDFDPSEEGPPGEIAVAGQMIRT